MYFNTSQRKEKNFEGRKKRESIVYFNLMIFLKAHETFFHSHRTIKRRQQDVKEILFLQVISLMNECSSFYRQICQVEWKKEVNIETPWAHDAS